MYEIFETLLAERGVTAYQVAKATGISTGSLSDWKNGRSSPKVEKLQKIATYFGVSVDYLLGNEQKEKPATDSDGLTEADRRDIAIELEQLMNEMTRSGNLMFDGDPATPEAMESLRNAMEMGLIYAKKINKDKLGK